MIVRSLRNEILFHFSKRRQSFYRSSRISNSSKHQSQSVVISMANSMISKNYFELVVNARTQITFSWEIMSTADIIRFRAFCICWPFGALSLSYWPPPGKSRGPADHAAYGFYDAGVRKIGSVDVWKRGTDDRRSNIVCPRWVIT
jgi:hypothetical protein